MSIEQRIGMARDIARGITGAEPSADAVFLAAFLALRDQPQQKPYPEWLPGVLRDLAGRSVTTSEIFAHHHGMKPSASEATKLAIALRAMGIKARRANGKNLFDL